MSENPSGRLRFIKRDLKPADVYNGRGFKYVLQQEWETRESASDTLPLLDWRDVPLVEEE